MTEEAEAWYPGKELFVTDSDGVIIGWKPGMKPKPIPPREGLMGIFE